MPLFGDCTDLSSFVAVPARQPTTAITAPGLAKTPNVLAFAGACTTTSVTMFARKQSLTVGSLPEQSGFAPLPTHFYFNVVKGTGSYAHVMAGGTIDFHYAPQVVPLHMTPGQPPPEAGGTFALTLQQITL